MKLFILSQDEVSGYDTYSDCIVCAEDEKEAILINPSNKCYSNEEIEEYGIEEWCTPKDVKCEYIGEAKEGLEKGVICASFHAG